MPTLFERINLQLQPGETISDVRRSQIGTIVYKEFLEKRKDTKPIYRLKFTTEKGIFNVVSYPHWFTELMDGIIDEELKKQAMPPPAPPIPERKPRRRIPAKIKY